MIEHPSRLTPPALSVLTPNDAGRPRSLSQRRDAAIDLVVVIVSSAAVRLAARTPAIRGWLPQMPVLEHAWLYFATTLALFVWLVRARRRTAVSLGVTPFSPPNRMLVLGLGGTLVILLVDIIVGPIVRSVFGATDLHRFTSLAHNAPAYIVGVIGAMVFAGFGEELLYRGMILTRLRILFGDGRAAIGLAVAIQAALFGLVHWYQGPSGMITVAIGGVLHGLLFLVSRSSIWPSVIAHGLIDALGFTLLFLGIMKT